jgi:hypothetical protein
MPRGLVSRDCDASLLKRARVTVPTASVLTLVATPVTLLAAPGPDRAIQVIECLIYNPATGTAYTEGNGATNTVLQYATTTTIPIASSETTLNGTLGAILSAAGTPQVQRMVFGNGSTTVYNVVINEAVVVTGSTNELAAGTNNLDFILTYRVLDLKDSNGAQAAVAYGTSVAV